MSSSWAHSCRAFDEASGWFVSTAVLVGSRWAEPALGEWNVRDLVGHTSRSFLTVEEYLGRPPASVDLETTADYYRATRTIAAGPGVAQRGRDAGEALGPDPAGAVAEIAGRVLRLVDSCDGTELLTTIAGGMRLRDYLPTRVFELVVHTSDLARALGEPVDPPASAAGQALGLVTELAVGDGTAGALLLAATGRVGLPPGFSVL